MSSRKHHKIRSCPVPGCNFNGGDLKRHLASDKHRGDVDVGSIDAVVQMVDKGSEKKGSNRLLIRWCPVEGCDFLTPHLRKHLQRKHGITNSDTLDALRQMSACYQPNKLPPSSSPSVRLDLDDDDDDGGDGDEDYRAPSVKAYFESPRITSDRHWFLANFYSHLASVDEGQKSDKERLQHASQVRTILEGIDPRGKDIEKIAADEGKAVWDLWVAPRLSDEKSIKALTLVSYMGSLKKFLNFVIQSQKRLTTSVPRVKTGTVAIFEDIVEKTKGWRSTIMKGSAVERNEHYLKECEERLTREDFQAFFRSPVIAEAESLFDSTTSKRPKVLRFSRARDYLITRLAVCCGTRPGPLETATLEHFDSARRDSIFKDCYVMLVPRHKRQMDGPAIVTMDERLHKFIQTYITDIRPTVVTSPDEQHLFLKVDGQPFESGTIGHRVGALWSRSGVRQGLRVTCTDFRKSFVTMVEEANKEERYRSGGVCLDDNDLRKLLCHSQKTAALWYMRENLTSLGARAHNALRRIREGPSTDALENDDETPYESVASASQTIEVSSTDTRPSVVQGQVAPIPTTASSPSLPLMTSSLQPTEVDSTASLVLSEPLDSPAIPLSSPIALSPFARAPPRQRREWSREDTAAIVRYLKSLNGRCPGKREIYDAFQQNPELIPISQRENLNRCVEKVKWEFRGLKQ